MINIHGPRLLEEGWRSRGWLQRIYIYRYIEGVDLCESFLPIPTALYARDPIYILPFVYILALTHVDRSRLEMSS